MQCFLFWFNWCPLFFRYAQQQQQQQGPPAAPPGAHPMMAAAAWQRGYMDNGKLDIQPEAATSKGEISPTKALLWPIHRTLWLKNYPSYG